MELIFSLYILVIYARSINVVDVEDETDVEEEVDVLKDVDDEEVDSVIEVELE